MRKVMVAALVLIMSLSAAVALCEDSGLHLLWDVPFGINGDEVVAQVKQNTGIELGNANDKAGNLLRYASYDNQTIKLAGMPITAVSFRDSSVFGLSDKTITDSKEFVFDDAVITFESLKKKTNSTDEAGVILWLDYLVLPEFGRSFLVPYAKLCEKYGEPTFSYYRKGYTDPATEVSDISSIWDAKFWLGDALSGGGFSTFQHVCAIWDNVELQGSFAFTYDDELTASLSKTIRYYNGIREFPMSTKKADIEVDF